MKSIKPGRGPSMMSGMIGILMACSGILWTVLAAQASIIFSLFGVIWTVIVILNTIHQFKNATGKNRYSTYDIVDASEEPDPFEERFGKRRSKPESGAECRFCPYCGTAAEDDHQFCRSCGKKLP